jgi:hypothetical protein
VLVLLTEISEDSFVVVTHLSRNIPTIISFVLSMALLNGLVYLFAAIGSGYLSTHLTKNECEVIAVIAFLFYAVYNILEFMRQKD